MLNTKSEQKKNEWKENTFDGQASEAAENGKMVEKSDFHAKL